jgi:hypothetical protein
MQGMVRGIGLLLIGQYIQSAWAAVALKKVL